MPSSSRAAGAEFLGLGVHVSGWRSARRCAPAALQLLRQMSRQHFDQRTQPAWHWDPQCEGLSVHLVTNKTCLVEFTVCPLKAGLGVFVSGTTGPRHAPTQINTPPIGGFYAHKKPELGSGRYLLTGHAVRGFFCCCRLIHLVYSVLSHAPARRATASASARTHTTSALVISIPPATTTSKLPACFLFEVSRTVYRYNIVLHNVRLF